ncbi:helix-turn-helix domain-containing protein [Acinetobacter terrae]|uniref:XRE family transcriptional regulator n=1 Tax=Acinetobacter terrae TaxID=2731247 RepID=A0A4R0EL28_9GAMM|nr:helix-turn-helix transcriptional regulator [Acinetobacter terrae]TCB58250.1 XRE family transcriptional regulator [Acinetobacter terrae]
MQFHRSDFPISIAEALGDRLKRARLNKNLTQNEVAQLAWISRRTVLNAEKGDVHILINLNRHSYIHLNTCSYFTWTLIKFRYKFKNYEVIFKEDSVSLN